MADFTSNVRKCILRSRNYKFKDVELPHATAVVVGRGPQTRIRERRCSKTQVEITSNHNELKATIRQLGSNPSEVDGKALQSMQSANLCDGSSINLLVSDLKYTLEFVKDDVHSKCSDDLLQNQSELEIAVSLAGSSKRETDCDPSSSKKVKHNNDEDNGTSGNCDVDSINAQLSAARESLAKELASLTTEETWEEYDHSKLLIYTTAGLRGKSKVAAFDLDHTIIATKSGKVFPVDTFDWKIMFAEIPGKMKDLNQKGYKIIIFTNQKGISRGRTSVHDFKKKIQSIVKRLGVPVQVFISTGLGRYRKPNIGMWDYLVQKGNQGVTVDCAESIYVGDAAGRVDKWAPKKKKDFSCADRLFATNLQLQFFTPEEFFMGQKPAQYVMPSFDPRKVGDSCLAVRYKPSSESKVFDASNIASSALEMIVFVGYPASGKSYFAKTYLIPKGYVHINRDTLGSWQKCVSECSRALGLGRSVVVDNTNPDLESRSRYFECARRYKAGCRCFLFNCTLEQARHNNRFRELRHPDAKHVGVNDMVFNSYKSKYKEPSLQEGFTEIVQVNFVPKFQNKQDETLYKMFLLEK